MHRENVGRVLLLITAAIPGLCITWFVAFLTEDALERRKDIECLRAEQQHLFYLVRAQSSRSLTAGDNNLKMQRLQMDALDRQWRTLIQINSEIADVKIGMDAIKQSIAHPETETERPIFR